jgi:hypothetical protein
MRLSQVLRWGWSGTTIDNGTFANRGVCLAGSRPAGDPCPATAGSCLRSGRTHATHAADFGCGRAGQNSRSAIRIGLGIGRGSDILVSNGGHKMLWVFGAPGTRIGVSGGVTSRLSDAAAGFGTDRSLAIKPWHTACLYQYGSAAPVRRYRRAASGAEKLRGQIVRPREDQRGLSSSLTVYRVNSQSVAVDRAVD